MDDWGSWECGYRENFFCGYVLLGQVLNVSSFVHERQEIMLTAGTSGWLSVKMC